jgi:hypothetical protein
VRRPGTLRRGGDRRRGRVRDETRLAEKMLEVCWTRVSRWAGSTPMKPMAITLGCRPGWKPAARTTSWRWSCDSRFTAPTGPWRADELARVAPRKGWQRLSAGQGSKGDRLYDWLVLDPGADEHLLLVRRSISKPTELAYYICHTQHSVAVAETDPAWRISMGCRGNVPVREERDPTGSLPSPHLPRLVPAHHLVHARGGVPRRHRPR